MTDFHQTRMGQRFYESTVPRIADALEKLAGAAEKLAGAAGQPEAEPPNDEAVDVVKELVFQLGLSFHGDSTLADHEAAILAGRKFLKQHGVVR